VCWNSQDISCKIREIGNWLYQFGTEIARRRERFSGKSVALINSNSYSLTVEVTAKVL